MSSTLPIESVLGELSDRLSRGEDVVLQAPPGAGKTTRVPLAILQDDWLRGSTIIMLEPRRLAARASARRMASLLGEQVGDTVGYRVRMDTRIGPGTRIEVVTEGVLTRMLQDNPELPGVGCVIFDEYHERSLQADLGLALTLDVRQALRADLRVIVMSATLDGARVASVLGDAPIVTSEGRTYPVTTEFVDRSSDDRLETSVARAVQTAVDEHPGDVLVFLPGAGEIRRCEERLQGLPEHIDVYPLFGNLSFREQDAAIEPSPEGRRKVVLSTDIAETSLTIEGVRVVVDSGLTREPRYDPASGMTHLVTRKIARSSADQRRGRAGRVAPGHCIRLWSRLDHQHRDEHSSPEIVHADLTPLVLELACWGITDETRLAWMTPPPPASMNEARVLLRQLGALDERETVTPHGRQMVRLGVHPRLAHMMMSANDQGMGTTACAIAALLSERDVLQPGPERPPADLRLRLQLLANRSAGGRRNEDFMHGYRVHGGALRRVERLAMEFARKAGVRHGRVQPADAGVLVARAYPDRVAQSRGASDTSFRLRSGQSVEVDSTDPLADADYLAVASVGGLGTASRIYQAAPIGLADIERIFADAIEEREVVEFDSAAGRVRARRQRVLGAVVLKEGPVDDADPEAIRKSLVTGIRETGLHVLPWDKQTRQLQERLAFMHHVDESWPDRSEEGLLDSLQEWLAPYLSGMRSLDDLRRLDLSSALQHGFSWERREELDRRAPTHIRVPSGSNIPLDYSDPEAPALPVRLQEVFGLLKTPTVDDGRVPVTMHLLSPAHRPVQITTDLESFWKRGYFDVRSDMRGRYPKHHWPEDPLSATPTSRAKRRGK